VPAEEDHRHCKVCGRVCDVDAQTCSRACRDQWAARVASRRNYTYLLYLAIAILVIGFAFSLIR
jgi:predicted nucleic acid-binding Zn ribbon protein